MKSIKNKLMFSILLINSLILIGILFFYFNFEFFYIRNISRNMSDLSYKIESILKSENFNENEIHEVIQNESLHIDIAYKNRVVFTNRNLPKGFIKFENRNYVYSKVFNMDNNITSYIGLDKIENAEYLFVKSSVDDFQIIIKTQISAIKQSVDIVFRFLMMIFIPIIFISIIWTIRLSKKFTNPIIKLNEISQKIANLDFTNKVEINTNDEIEELGESINKLSNEIEKRFIELRDKNEKLELMIKNKEKEENLKREFVGSVSHELKTPITVISGYTQGLMSGIIESDEDKNYYLETIFEESEKMSSMVNELLNLYKLESRTLKLNKENVNIKTLSYDIIKKFEFRLKNTNVEFNVEDFQIYCDKNRITQVINNFLDNAIYHLNYNKEIKIYTSNIEDKIKFSIFNTGENIIDTEKIWYSFQRVDEVRTSSNRIGLGLSICKEILEMHEFEYGVENKEHGVEFYFIVDNRLKIV